MMFRLPGFPRQRSPRAGACSAELGRADLLDPVEAYDRLAPAYARVAQRRAAYLEGIERLIGAGVAPGSRSLLDVGAGPGVRSVRIAQAAGLHEVTLLEPSAAMRSGYSATAAVWPIRAEELGSRQGRFDVVTCLWNVLGHVFPAAARAEVLRHFARLGAPGGCIFVDVNHRYNARHYGAWRTAGRWLRDRLAPAGANGDVQVRWDIEGCACATGGHVFTHSEFRRLVTAAGLRIERRFIVDYETGRECRHPWQGHLLYRLGCPADVSETSAAGDR